MSKKLDKKLDISATKLQKGIYNLACLLKTGKHKESWELGKIKYQIKDYLEAIKQLNSDFKKNYETDLESIINHYKCPLAKEGCPRVNLDYSYEDVEAVLEKVAV